MKRLPKRTKVLLAIVGLIILVIIIRNSSNILGVSMSKKWNFEYEHDDIKLEALIEKELNTKNGEYSVVVEAYESSGSATPFKQAHINDKEVFPAASLYKLFLMAAVMQEIENGNLKMTQVVSSNKTHLDEVLGGTEYGYEEIDGDISFTVDQAMDRIARLSDNYAAIMLVDKVGWNKIQLQAQNTGATNTQLKNPITTTASDISLFMRNLYQGKVVSPTSSQKILDYLARSQINNRIPKQLPKGVKIAHKTGELARVRHDAGVVYLERSDKELAHLPDGRAYVIVLMSKNLQFEDSGIESLAKVSKVVYDYLTTGNGE